MLSSPDVTHGVKIFHMNIEQHPTDQVAKFHSRNGRFDDNEASSWNDMLFFTPCLQLTNSNDQEDAQLMRLMEPNSTIGPRLLVRAMVFESLYGLDMLAPSTADPKLTVWVTPCLTKQLLCRQQGFVGTTKQGETLETLASTSAGTTTSTHSGIHFCFLKARRDSSRPGEQDQIVRMIPCSSHTDSDEKPLLS